MAYGKGGFGGMGGMNMQAMMKQAQKLQEQMNAAREEIRNTEVEGIAGGMVTVTMTGDKRVTGVSINPAAVDPDDVEMLEDIILAALNDANQQADKLSKDLLGPMGGAAGLF